MGCDIHPCVQRRFDGAWEFVLIPGADQDDSRNRGDIWWGLCGRNYDLFAVLADVRNGVGFAGCITGEVIRPISAVRGLPPGFAEGALPKWAGKYADADALDLGEHSFSWVTLAELAAYDWDASRRCFGVMDRRDFEAWDGTSPPANWSGGVFGRSVVSVTEKVARARPAGDWTHVQVTWRQTMRQSCPLFVGATLPWLRTLGVPDDVRLVFGFDS